MKKGEYNDEDPSVKKPFLPAVIKPGSMSSNKPKLHPTGDDTSVFCQMDVLYHFQDGEKEWREAARWLKYEEKVEIGHRWSKPYVATLSLHALFQFRQCLFEGTVLLDLEGTNLPQIIRKVLADMGERKGLSTEVLNELQSVLLKPHKHQHRKGKRKGIEGGTEITDLPLMRKTSPTSSPGSANGNQSTTIRIDPPSSDNPNTNDGLLHRFAYDGNKTAANMAKYKSNKKFKRKIPKGSEVANILVGEVECLKEPIMAFVRLADSAVLGDMTEVELPTRYLFVLVGPPEQHSIWEYEEVGRAAASLLTDKIFADIAYNADGRDDLLLGIDEFIDDLTVLPPSIWDPETRLSPPDKAPGSGHGGSSNQALRARRRTASREKHVTLPGSVDEKQEMEEPPEVEEEDQSLMRTGRLFGGMWLDIKRRYPKYWSDIRDGLSIQCFASIIFLYFACVTPIITFGGLLGIATDNYLGIMESIVSGCICGLIYHTFAGQPLTIMGATGPLLVFESIMYGLCRDFEWDYMSFRFWSGAWCALVLLLMVAFDLSSLVRMITRFTEESFSVLISLIFIVEAFSKVFKINKKYPIKTSPDDSLMCHCKLPDCSNVEEWQIINGTGCMSFVNTSISHINDTIAFSRDCLNFQGELIVNSHHCISEHDCSDFGGNLTGEACNIKNITHAVPDVFLMSIFLFLIVFCVAFALAMFRNSRFATNFVRNLVADFAVTLGIVAAVLIDMYVGLPTPKLSVPAEFKPSNPNRGWLVNPIAMTHWWIVFVAAIPGILVTILIFLDQQITAVIVNRKEHRLKKGHGYHLDLFVLAILILICSALGLPWFVAATVRSITHARSLMKQSEASAPGEKPQFLGIREQRVTGICIHILIGVSIFLTTVLKVIPMPVLYGVFLYMGVMSLRGVQFVQRILILFMPKKYQPDYVYLRHVRTSRVHIFTIVQIICMATMWAVKSVKKISIMFPITILALIAVRKIMGRFFSNQDMEWLDDLSPEEARRAKEDKAKKNQQGEHLSEYDVDKKDEKVDIKHHIELRPFVKKSVTLAAPEFDQQQLSISDKISSTNFWRQMTTPNNNDTSESPQISNDTSKSPNASNDVTVRL